MKVITVASDLNNDGFKNFLQPSCERYQLDAIVLEYEDSVFFSNRLKDLLLEAYLKVSDDDEEVIFFTDATDAVFVSGEEEILQKFNAFNAPLVFSAEVNCWPDKALAEGYPAPETHFRYLNTGGFIGRAGYIRALYQKYPIFKTANDPSFRWSNQYYWNTIYKMESDSIKIDHYCDIFYNTAIPLEDYAAHKQQLRDPVTVEALVMNERNRLDIEICFKDGRLENSITRSWPCHIHFPGTISGHLMRRGYFESLKSSER